MSVAEKSSKKDSRATLSLPRETYHKIDGLRGEETRSAWLVKIVAQEEERREREGFLKTLHEQYTEEVCRETLLINDDFSVHES